MDNKNFIEILAERVGLDKDRTSKIAEQLCRVIAENIMEEDCVVVSSFGVFEPKKKLERVVIHPTTGKKLLVPPRLTLGFKPSSMLKSIIRKS